MDWQPIETAPKDGKADILTVGPDCSDTAQPTRWLKPGPYFRGARASYHRPEGWYWAGYDGAVGPIRATHWMPMPNPPKGI